VGFLGNIGVPIIIDSPSPALMPLANR
jgi:hypothetical protein